MTERSLDICSFTCFMYNLEIVSLQAINDWYVSSNYLQMIAHLLSTEDSFVVFLLKTDCVLNIDVYFQSCQSNKVRIMNTILDYLNSLANFHLIVWYLLKQGYLRACSQIPVYDLTGRGLGGRSVAPGAGFCGQNLGIKYIPCVGTHLWITMAAKSALSYCQIYWCK